LHLLCKSGLSIVSWIIVFIPFMLMTVIVTILLYYFGLNSTLGQEQPTISNSYTLTKLSNSYPHGHCYSINQPYYHGISQMYCK
jgi:hypothetical protein